MKMLVGFPDEEPNIVFTPGITEVEYREKYAGHISDIAKVVASPFRWIGK